MTTASDPLAISQSSSSSSQAVISIALLARCAGSMNLNSSKQTWLAIFAQRLGAPA
jgi:hypothetical protein